MFTLTPDSEMPAPPRGLGYALPVEFDGSTAHRMFFGKRPSGA